MTLNIPEAKCKVHIAMRYWPDVDADTAAWLRSLHWRIRRAVELVHGEERTLDQAAAQLRVSPSTVTNDLSRAYDRFTLMDEERARRGYGS